MSGSTRSSVCQRCGRGFIVTEGYLDFLAQRGAKIKVPMLCMTCFVKAGPLPKQQGKVKWFNPRKHYGFIATGGDQDVFVHQRQVLGDDGNGLQEGQTVLFHSRYAKKGPEALNVELV
jgi:CspA family cold shock protein